MYYIISYHTELPEGDCRMHDESFDSLDSAMSYAQDLSCFDIHQVTDGLDVCVYESSQH